MKLKNFVYPLLFGIITVAGFLIGNFSGGFVAGAGAMLLIFVTLGKYLAKKAQQRIDASIALRRKMYDSTNR